MSSPLGVGDFPKDPIAYTVRISRILGQLRAHQLQNPKSYRLRTNFFAKVPKHLKHESQPKKVRNPQTYTHRNSEFPLCIMSQWKYITGVFFKEISPQNALKAELLDMGMQPVSVSSLLRSSGPRAPGSAQSRC